jgi:hypothetical protein
VSLWHRPHRAIGPVRARAGRPGGGRQHFRLDHLKHRARRARVTCSCSAATSINKSPRKADLKALESNLRGHRIPRHVMLPEDERLRQMLDSGTYVCERLERRTRTAVKPLALAVADQLV